MKTFKLLFMGVLCMVLVACGAVKVNIPSGATSIPPTAIPPTAVPPTEVLPTVTLVPTDLPVPTATPIPVIEDPSIEIESDSLEGLMQSPYMLAYQDLLEYTVSDEYSISESLDGFLPVTSLVSGPFQFNRSGDGRELTIDVPNPPGDVTPWECFPQDYSVSDFFNRGCQELQNNGLLPWPTPEAGYNDGNNWACETPDGWCSDTISPFNWRVYTGYRVCHPAVGCLQDPDGGAVMLLVVNFHDSVETWNVRDGSAIFVDDGFVGYGMMWDLEEWTYDAGNAISDVRNHYLFNLSQPVGGDNRYAGQCGSSDLCSTVTWVVVARSFDRPDRVGIEFSHFVLLGAGQWVRP